MNEIEINGLPSTTVRIETRTINGESGFGTGFYFEFLTDERGAVPTIVTNKHVVEDADAGYLYLDLADEKGNRIEGSHQRVEILDFEKRCIMHPDPNVDLCVLPIAEIFNKMDEIGFNPFYGVLSKSMLPTEETISVLTNFEEIIMIGYPNGLWDAFNNRPIIRRGLTATHPNLNYNGKEVFLIDAACFPGSSGSPVFILNQGSISRAEDGSFKFREGLFLLGILYAGPQQTIEGNIEIIDIPTQQVPIAVSRIMMNLGYVIKAQKLLDFELIFQDIRNKSKSK